MRVIIQFIVVVIFMLGLSSCSGGGDDATATSGGDNGTPTVVQPVSVNGLAQKGPYVLGSSVTVYQLDSSYERTSDLVESTISDTDGHYSIVIPWRGMSEVVIRGYYFDETTGMRSLEEATLTTIVEITDGGATPPNVNIFTHLAALRIKALMQEGKSLAEAKQIAVTEIMGLFGYLDTEGLDFGSLDLTELFGDNATVNAELLRLSAALLDSNYPLEDLELLIALYNEGGIEAVLNSAIFARIQEGRYNVDMDATMQTSEIDADGVQIVIPTTATISKLMTSPTLYVQLRGTRFSTTAPTITLISEPQGIVSIESIVVADDNNSAQVILSGNTDGCQDHFIRLIITADGLDDFTTDLYSNKINLHNPLTICQTENGDEALVIPPNYPPVAVIGTRSDLNDQENRQITTYVGVVVRGLETIYSHDTEHYPLGQIVHCEFKDENDVVVRSSSNSDCGIEDKIFMQAGNYDYTLTVTDNLGATASNVAHIEVLANALPVLTLIPDMLDDIMMGESVSIGASASDPDNDLNLHFLWTFRRAGSTLDVWDNMTEHFTRRFDEPGAYVITAHVADSHGAIVTKELQLNVINPNPFVFKDLVGVEIQKIFSSTVTVDWLGVDEVVTLVVSGDAAYQGASVNGINGDVEVRNGDTVTAWHRSANSYGITYNTTITVGAHSDTFSTTTKATENTKLPLIVGAPNTRGNINELYTYTPQLSTDDSEFAPATKPFTISNQPVWATFDPQTGTLSGIPRIVGEYRGVEITATGDGGIDIIRFDISVSNDGPYISGWDLSLENSTLVLNFNDNADWRSRVVDVQLGTCYGSNLSSLASSDYSLTAGHLTLNVATSTNVMLHTPIMGGGQILVKAIGYGDAYGTIDFIQDGQYAIKATMTVDDETGALNETSLDGAGFDIVLGNYLQFTDNVLDVSSFHVSEAPIGTTVVSVTYIDATKAHIVLAFDKTDFDEVKNLSISIASSELNSCQSVVSNTLSITPFIEVPYVDTVYQVDAVEKSRFANKVAIDNQTIAAFTRNGIYVYQKDSDGNYVLTQKLADGGDSLALDGDYLVIGNSTYTDTLSSDPRISKIMSGIVYVYKKGSDGQFTKVADILPDDLVDSDHFGEAVDISGNLIIVGATNADHHKGMAFLIENDGNDHFEVVERFKRENGKPMDNFGADVAIDGEYFVVGSRVYTHYANGEVDYKPELGAGFVHYYRYADHKVDFVRVLQPDDSGDLSDQFGSSVAISGDRIVVGAQGNGSGGAIYLFKRAFNTAFQEKKLSGEVSYERFGSAVAVQYDGYDVIATNQYKITEVVGGNYVRTAVSLDRAGSDVAIDDNEIVYGASFNSDNGLEEGALVVINVQDPITGFDDDVAYVNFESEVDVSLSTMQYAQKRIEGLNTPVALSIENGEYSFDNGAHWSNQTTTITNHQLLRVRHMSAGSFSSTVETVVHIGTLTRSFITTTRSENYRPYALPQTIVIRMDSADNVIHLEGRDRDNDILSTTVVLPPQHGSMMKSNNYTYYTPNKGYIGADSFTYRVNDDTLDSTTVEVNIMVASIVKGGIAYETVVSPNTQKIWLDRNLGASRPCATAIDSECFGDYYQWGRNKDGHEQLSSYVRHDVVADSLDVGNGDFYKSSPLDWTNSDLSGSERSARWESLLGDSICPADFRVPTMSELLNEMSSGDKGAFLALGLGTTYDGINSYYGYLWSSTPTATKAKALHFKPDYIAESEIPRYEGYNVRCITNMPVSKPINVLQTGVTISRTSGDDGDLQKGQVRAYSRDSTSGIVSDLTTGLQWQDNAVVDYSIYGGYSGSKAQDKARTYCAAKSMGGYDDWRLPSIEELATLVNYANASYRDMVFENIEAISYMSSTEHGSAWAWVIDFDRGMYAYHDDDSHDNLLCVRGDALVDKQFYRLANGTIKDFSSNLIWQDSDINTQDSIGNAIGYCNSLSLGGITDWRVPNMNELLSIKDFSKTAGAALADIFEDRHENSFYSSTSNNLGTGYWSQWFTEGGNSQDGSDLQTTHYVRCVSGENKYIEVP